MLRIGFNARSLMDHGGIGAYTRSLLRYLVGYTLDDYLAIFVPKLAMLDFLPPGTHWRGIEIPGGNRVLWEQYRLPAAIAQEQLDLFHSPDFTLPGRLPVPGIVTVHDLSFLLHPEGVAPRTRWLYRTYVPKSVAKAALVLCDSQATCNDLRKQGWGPAHRLLVLPLGVEERFFEELEEERILDFTARAGIPRDYVLYLGALDKRKNLPTLLKAYRLLLEELPSAVPAPALVLAGPDHGERGALEQLAHALDVADSVNFLGYVDDADLPALFQGARLFCYPSLFEGFGLPPLQAMAAGTPVVASNTTSLPEVVGSAGILLEASDPIAWAGAMADLLSDRAQWMALHRAGQERARPMTWRHCARLTYEAYLRVVREERGIYA
ncbi:MAG TPA: glycosyltransferase family 1 protein [bacterium]|nr:glycosyltransferase family 1 protein [bacterium]